MTLTDQFGRQVDYLRLSVIDRCNLRCHFCMPMHGLEFFSQNELLTFDEIILTLQVANSLGIDKLRLTGGEPLLQLDDDLVAALESYIPANNRSQVIETAKNMLILDAYNANPSSMRTAVENFMNMKGGPKVLVLGDMLELGEKSFEEHQKFVDYLYGLDVCMPLQ